MDPDKLVTVATFNTESEAQLASAKLETLGIASTLMNANASILYGNALESVELQVRAADAAAASEALAEVEMSEAPEDEEEEEVVEDDTAPENDRE